MKFEEALPLAREGRRIAREGWNGKGLWVAMQTPDAHSKMGRPYMYIKSVDDTLVPWAPSQTDLLEDDWGVLLGEHGEFFVPSSSIGIFVDGGEKVDEARPAEFVELDRLLHEAVEATKEAALGQPMAPIWYAFDFGVEYRAAPFMFRMFFVAVDNAAPGLYAGRGFRPGLTRSLEEARKYNDFAECAAWCADNPGFHPETIRVQA